MVVFEDAVAKKAHYRKFAVRGRRRAGRLRVDARGDLAALLAPRRRSGSDDWNESFAATPNLVVIDGGKGQLSRGARRDAGARPAARRGDRAREADRRGLRPGPTRADRARRAQSPALQLLQRIRDEAHRFAITLPSAASRHARARVDVRPARGVGPARRRALLQHFGSAERVVAATQEELEGVPGVPARTARRIYAQLHRDRAGLAGLGGLAAA